MSNILHHERLQVNNADWMVEVWVGEDKEAHWCAWKGTRYQSKAADSGEGICFDAQNAIVVPVEILKIVDRVTTEFNKAKGAF